ncbi:hypothetical protein HK096_000918, partial [Nowakowskiella sp. JEL0078]
MSTIHQLNIHEADNIVPVQYTFSDIAQMIQDLQTQLAQHIMVCILGMSPMMPLMTSHKLHLEITLPDLHPSIIKIC